MNVKQINIVRMQGSLFMSRIAVHRLGKNASAQTNLKPTRRAAKSRSALCRLLALLASFMLAACIPVDAPVFGANDAQDVPGVVGAWRQQAGQTTVDLFIRRNADRTFSSGSTKGKYDLDWIGIALGNGYYIGQTQNDKGEVFLCLVRVLPNSLIFFRIQGQAVQTASAAAGVSLGVKNDNVLIHAASGKSKVIAMFRTLVESGQITDGEVYTKLSG